MCQRESANRLAVASRLARVPAYRCEGGTVRGVDGSGQDGKFRLVIVHNDHLAVGQAALQEVEKFLKIKHGKDLSAHVDNAKRGEETTMKTFVRLHSAG